MKYKLGAARILLLDSTVQIGFPPVFDSCGFAFDQIPAHGEFGSWQVKSIFQIHV